MADFHEKPVVGEPPTALHENEVSIGPVCHAPVAMTSAKYRVDDDGGTLINEDHSFRGARITTVPTFGEVGTLMLGCPKIPGQKMRPHDDVDVALDESGHDVQLTIKPSAVRVVWDEEHGLLTGNGRGLSMLGPRISPAIWCRRRDPLAVRRRSR